MTVSEKELTLALEILRNNHCPNLNLVLEMVLKHNSSIETRFRLDFMKINLLVTQLAHSFIHGKIVSLTKKEDINTVEHLLAVA